MSRTNTTDHRMHAIKACVVCLLHGASPSHTPRAHKASQATRRPSQEGNTPLWNAHITIIPTIPFVKRRPQQAHATR